MALPRVPINPRLNFGEPLENVCSGGFLHPGLKELFSKAYFSAHPSECLLYNEEIPERLYDENSSAAWILTILKFAQGTVAVRLALKERLENGRWLLPLQVPPAAPLWMIRHFLGRLPIPLIFCLENSQVDLERWRRKLLRLSTECHIASYKLACSQKLHSPLQKKIVLALSDMKSEACLVLFSLITLIRNLSHDFTHEWINSRAVSALLEYFTPAIMSRPYRPGFLTKDDKGLIALLEYLCDHFPEIKALCKTSNSGSRVKFTIEVPKSFSSEQQDVKFGQHPGLKTTVMEDLRQMFPKTPQKNIQPQQESNEIQKLNIQQNEPKRKSVKETMLGNQYSRSSQSHCSLQQLEVETASANQEETCCNKEENSKLQNEITFYSSEKVSKNDVIPEQFPDANQESSHPKEREQIFSNSTIRKCQALKLAYKLRAQCLAWRLAGLFIDGVSSPISDVCYTKLPHDLPN